MSYLDCFPTVSCDYNGYWLPDDIEQKYEVDFMELLHSCKSYEEFMVRSELANKEFDAAYFGFNTSKELFEFIQAYYNGGFISAGEVA